MIFGNHKLITGHAVSKWKQDTSRHLVIVQSGGKFSHRDNNKQARNSGQKLYHNSPPGSSGRSFGILVNIKHGTEGNQKAEQLLVKCNFIQLSITNTFTNSFVLNVHSFVSSHSVDMLL